MDWFSIATSGINVIVGVATFIVGVLAYKQQKNHRGTKGTKTDGRDDHDAV